MSASVTNINDARSFVKIDELFEKLAPGKTLGVANAAGEREGVCLSPLHDDENPSCHYNVNTHQWHCKPCGKGGGYIALVQHAMPNLETKDAARNWLKANGFDTSVQATWDRVDVTYDYVDEHGDLVLQVGRWNKPKHFGQRVPDGKSGWKYSLKDLKRRVPFMLPDLLKAVSRGETVYVVEGEKDALALNALGYCATTNPQGAKWKWPLEWAGYFKGAAKVVVIADNDAAGRDGARQRAGVIARECPSTFVVESMPDVAEKGDVSDWIAAQQGDVAAAFERAVDAIAVKVEPYVPKYPVQWVGKLVENLDDTGNGYWFAQCFGYKWGFEQRPRTYAWIPARNAWFAYANGVWSEGAVMQEATQKAVELMGKAGDDYDGPLTEDFADHVKRSRNVVPRQHMLESAKGNLSEGTTKLDVLDKHPMLLNFANGVLDLQPGAELKLLDHDPALLLTKQLPYDYDADAACPNWEAWLRAGCTRKDDDGSDVFDEDLFDYIHMVLGSCLIGLTGFRRFFFIFGPKGTGKSTVVFVMEAALGSYKGSIDYKALTESRFADGNGPSPALARLKGLRMVTASEARESDKLDAARIKQLIGGDIVSARDLNEKLGDFKFEATLIGTGNEVPRIIGGSDVWDKFKPIPFMHEIGEANEDVNFADKHLIPELPGIMNWLIAGLKKLQAINYRLEDPQAVVASRTEVQDAQDTIADWFEATMELSPADRMPYDALYDNYVQWCGKKRQWVHKQKMITSWLKNKHGVDVNKSNNVKTYIGVRPKLGSRDEPGF